MSATFLLLTIPASHYCEKARWALQRAGLAYREFGHAPLFSRIAARRYGHARSVPVLLTPSGALMDSTAIIRHADLALPAEDRLFPGDPEVDRLVARFDADLGPHSRRLAYFHGLPDRALTLSLLTRNIPGWERIFVTVFLSILRAVMRRTMRIDETGARLSREKLDQIFVEVSERLQGGRRFLVDDHFTAADLTFAALAAPVVLPPTYGGGLPPLDRWSAGMQADVNRYRATPAGEFCLRIYKDLRQESPKMFEARR